MNGPWPIPVCIARDRFNDAYWRWKQAADATIGPPTRDPVATLALCDQEQAANIEMIATYREFKSLYAMWRRGEL